MHMNARPLDLLAVALTFAAAPGLAHAVAVPGQGTWESTLQARDINSDGAIDAYYDTDLNITWLADANYAKTSGFVTTSPFGSQFVGVMDWWSGNAWASGLDLYGVTGWRLPSSTLLGLAPGCGSETDHIGCTVTPDPTFSEMAHMFYTTLGNATGGLSNTGPISNLQSNLYYNTSTFVQAGNPFAFRFSFGSGAATLGGELGAVPGYAWAVHDGDVRPAVPEPETYALMLLGLAALGVMVRRAKRSSVSA